MDQVIYELAQALFTVEEIYATYSDQKVIQQAQEIDEAWIDDEGVQ